jgi:hypothetical protein
MPENAPLRYWDTKPHVIAASGSNGFFDWKNELPSASNSGTPMSQRRGKGPLSGGRNSIGQRGVKDEA